MAHEGGPEYHAPSDRRWSQGPIWDFCSPLPIDLETAMSSVVLLVIAVSAVGALAILGIVTAASGIGSETGPLTLSELRSQSTAQRARATRGGAGATLVDPPLDPDLDRLPITSAEYNVTRRRFFNRATYAVVGLVAAQFVLASLAFMWPKLKAGFGGTYNAGGFTALKGEVIQGSTVVPKFFPAAQAWVVPMERDLLSGSSYEKLPAIITGGEDDGIGLMALWMRCPHLGCRVPECIPSQGFECPCHGSKFNIHGEYAAGPAPRNMDRFVVTTNEAGELIIDTGTIIQTPRSKTYTAQYPVGPFCV